MPLIFGQAEPKHVINWIVVRHPDFIDELDRLKPAYHDDNSVDAKAFRNTNVLISHMQNQGPIRHEQPNYTYDKIHDLYHCHVTNASPAYNVIWEADENLRIIHILHIKSHENFKYARKINKTESIDNALSTLQKGRQYKKMLQDTIPLNPDLKEMYKDFITGTTSSPKKTKEIKSITYEEMGLHLIKRKPKP